MSFQTPVEADCGRSEHWNDFYSKKVADSEASPFAQSVLELLDPPSRLLEVGCGNGRDSRFFFANGHSVTAIDRSEAAIAYCQTRGQVSTIDFRACTLASVLDELQPFDIIYSRFAIHAMPLEEELEVLTAAESVGNFSSNAAPFMTRCPARAK